MSYWLSASSASTRWRVRSSFFDDPVDLSALGGLAQAPGDGCGIADGLPERRIGEQGVDPARGRCEVAYRLVDRRLAITRSTRLMVARASLSNATASADSSATGSSSSFLFSVHDQRVQVLAELLDVGLVETGDQVLDACDDLAGEAWRRGDIGIVGFPARTGAGDAFCGSRKSSVRCCCPVMPASCVRTRRPRFT